MTTPTDDMAEINSLMAEAKRARRRKNQNPQILKDLYPPAERPQEATNGLSAKVEPILQAIVKSTNSEDKKQVPDLPPDDPATESWPVLDQDAYHGLAGEFVKALEPHTEADPAGVLIQLLIAFGNIVGNSPYYQVESSQHHTNTFAVLVGKSSRSRKGTGAGRVMKVCELADGGWFSDRTASGLSSGEGLIDHVRDAVVKWNPKEKRDETVDPGIKDKRLLVTEEEFAGALSVMERHGNKLSSVIRLAWDGRKLQTMTKSLPLQATGAHVSLIGHITKDEIRAKLTRTDMANGFANRFLFPLVRRSKHLPHGGHFPDTELERFGNLVDAAIKLAKTVGRVTMTDTAAKAWEATYEELSAERPGLIGAVTARAEAQVIRLSLIFALLDSKKEINTAHLKAAMAVWAYCDESASLIFGDSLGDPAADEILAALHNNTGGMTRTTISNLFGRNRTSDQISAALQVLLRAGRAKFETSQTTGRPVERWFAIGGSK
jgi:hypothetical protein